MYVLRKEKKENTWQIFTIVLNEKNYYLKYNDSTKCIRKINFFTTVSYSLKVYRFYSQNTLVLVVPTSSKIFSAPGPIRRNNTYDMFWREYTYIRCNSFPNLIFIFFLYLEKVFEIYFRSKIESSLRKI